MTASNIDVYVHEVGTRDGLQSVPFFVPTETKKAWCSAEAAAGVREIEVCSFVPVKLLPQFADAAEIVAHALSIDGLTVAALAPNLKGAERAIELGVHKINYVLSVSESHNRANVRRSTEESVNDFARVVEAARAVPESRRPRIVAGLATALGCTIEGKVAQERVRKIALEVAAAGADELIIADTVGYADPASVRRLLRAVKSDVGNLPIKAHFHDTRGLGLANVLAALDADVRAFDASLGGLGGCPYAPGASGNICTEDLVFMLEAMGLKTGVDIEKLLALRQHVEQALEGQPFHGTIARAGLPKGFVSL
ncbi:MAG TPA: hydroxymethylglutaryl-CoA lyase [Burkholderiales bacterium]|nr:hydroxymethylglutaryl-CoA lyase [Burkholderiales bacterium]